MELISFVDGPFSQNWNVGDITVISGINSINSIITGMFDITDIGGINSSSITGMGGITNIGGMIIN